MTRFADLVVLGGGPAGANAAIAAAERGLDVVLIEESPAAGGQVWRAPWAGLDKPAKGPEARDGAALRAALAASKVETRFGRRVWSVTDGFRLDAVGPDGNETVEAAHFIAATGAHERVVPFPGWTLPGVVGLAAATIMLKSHGVLPGQKVVVAGRGPLLAAVAAGILEAGGTVLAVIDAAPRSAWLSALPALATRPGLLAQGARWMGKVLAARVPVLSGHAIVRAEGEDSVSRVVAAPVDAEGAFTGGRERVFEVDGLCVGHGLVPGADIPRLMRATMRFDRRLGGFVPMVDPFGRTSVPGLYAVGDGAGIRGAASAVHAGRLAGLAAARDSGRLCEADFGKAKEPDLVALLKLSSFSDAMAGMMALRPAQVAAIPAETVVCRCEDVTRAEIDAAAREGASDVNQLKHFTRCGMGPCQGRMCGDVAAELLAAHVGGREKAGYWTGRPPLRPVPLDAMLGSFTYDDIPIPEPAPL